MPFETASIARLVATSLLAIAGCASQGQKPTEASPTTAPVTTNTPAASPVTQQPKWISLFDGKDLGHWKPTEFGGQGESKVEDGNLLLTHGETLTGVTWQGPLPAKMDYEIELDAQRVDGNDFFVGLTFPVNKDCASLILGGWGGGVCGISSIDGDDAARNDTSSVHEFDKGKWYHVRLRVTENEIEAWLDKEQIVDAHTKGKKISVRGEVEPSQPLGLATYQTTGAIKNIRMRVLDEKD